MSAPLGLASSSWPLIALVLDMPHSLPLTRASFLTYILPPFVCQFSLGVLVQLDRTRTLRLALLPIMLGLAWRATWIDMSGGDPTKTQANSMLVTQIASMATRSAVWAFTQLRYRRLSPVIDNSDPDSVYTAYWNTWDLLINPRGIGWNWPRGLVVPRPTSEARSRLSFLLSMAAGSVFHILAFDACVQTVRVLSPDTFGSLNGGPLFDHILPPILEYLRALLVAFMAAASAYFGLQYTYKFLAIVCILAFHQHPSQWPPLFDAPWLSTSLGELWGRRWHQMMRDMLLTLGSQPLQCLFGRLGGLLGAFFVSGIFHVIELGRGGHTAVVVGFWVMNGVGVVLERLWTKATGRLVAGVWGRAWMVGWLVLWGVPMADVYAKVGRFGALSVVGGFEPSLALVAFVRGFIEAARTFI